MENTHTRNTLKTKKREKRKGKGKKEKKSDLSRNNFHSRYIIKLCDCEDGKCCDKSTMLVPDAGEML